MRAALTLAVGLAVSSLAWAHGGDEPRVSIEPESNLPVQSNDVTYEFQLVDTVKNVVLADADLQLTHQMKLHFFAYDPALKEFQHVHPGFNGKVWTTDLHFDVSGSYWLWAQGQLADGTEFATSIRLDVQVAKAAWPAPPKLTDLRSGADGVSVATLDGQKLKAGKMAMLMLDFTRSDGTAPNITPYLGEFAHLVVVPDDGDEFIHVHPMSTAKPDEGMLHITFPSAGLYRIWIQFMDGGVLKLVPLAVKVL
jgi:hypothetical protein